ncbi:SDR family oxidoreductase [Streptomyces sp. HPF1205]|uniref:SDR family oxidoreductase n=1 Tax=Streptomyces sp. HPF1205 TaxID=2873262 RepID=UPI001CECF2F3|nr:NAD(P)H-binding protein [Streptomyces sp. HPF1205]
MTALPILVTGGTGTLGRRLVPRLRAAGAQVRVLTRGAARADEAGITYVTGDLTTGEGVEAAVTGVGTIVHCAGTGKGDDELTRRLVAAVKAVGTEPHLVFISVVGADRVPVNSAVDRAMFSYFGFKRAAEQVVAESGLPWTTLRAAQFHDLVLTVARAMTKLPVVPCPAGMAFQPVDTDEVAARLTELALGEPAGLVPDMAGPRVVPFADLVRAYLRATGRRRLLLPLPLPGAGARAIRSGATVAPDHAVGTRTWEDFLSGLEDAKGAKGVRTASSASS